MSKNIQKTLERDFRGRVKEIPDIPPESIGKKQIKHDIPDNFILFNELIGLPKHPHTNQIMPLMPYQTEFFKEVHPTRQVKFHINKARQMGFSELVLRIIAYHSFFKYKGKQIIIIAGTGERLTATKLMRRFKMLFENIPEQVYGWTPGKRVIDIGPYNQLLLKNGTFIQALPSNSGAVRGDTKIGAIIMDEAAHFDAVDDSPVMDSVGPIVFTNQSDLFMLSTPNGRRGFFYNLSRDPQDYILRIFSYRETIGFLYASEDWDKELSRTDIDVEQEYKNQYTTTRRSYYGDVFATGEHEEERVDNI